MQIKQLINNNFNKNVFTLLGGSVIGQAFVFLITPILSRIYSQEVFGHYFIFIAIINILKKVVTLRYELLIIISKDDSLVYNSLVISLFVNFLISLIVFITILIILFLRLFNNLNFNLLLIPLSLMFLGLFEIYIYLCNRYQRYKQISFLRILNYFLNGIMQLLFFYIFSGIYNGLILGFVFANIFCGALGAIFSIIYLSKHKKYFSKNKIRYLIKTNKKVPIFNTLINFVNSFSNELPLYMITGFYGAVSAGLYGMSNKLLGTPLDIMGQSIGNVFFQGSVKEYYSNNLKNYFYETLKRIILFGALICFGILLLTPFLDIILGNEWKNIRILIVILLPAYYVNFINQPFTSLPTIIRKQDIYLYYQIVFILFKAISIYLGYLFGSFYWSLIMFSIVALFYRIIIFRWFRKQVI